MRDRRRWPVLPVSARVWLVFRRNLIVFKKIWLTNIGFNFLEPLLYLAALGLGLGVYVKVIDGYSYVQWIAPGLIASTAMWATASENTYESFVRMNYQKVFHAIAATPINLEEVVVGEMLFGVFKSILYGSVFLLVITIAGLVESPWAVLVPLALVLCGIVFAILAMAWTGLVPKIDQFSYFFTLLITPMFLFGGIFFPLEGTSLLVQRIAWFIPLNHVVRIVRSLVLGQFPPALWQDFLWLITFTALTFPIPILLTRRRLIQ